MHSDVYFACLFYFVWDLKLILIECQIMICVRSWTTNELIKACGELNWTGQNIFKERHFNCWRHFRTQFEIPTTCNKYFLRQQSFDQRPCKTAQHHMFLNCVCICLYCLNLHVGQFNKWKWWINHSDYKTWPFSELRNKEKFVFLTTNDYTF